jgi:hypothetical protein
VYTPKGPPCHEVDSCPVCHFVDMTARPMNRGGRPRTGKNFRLFLRLTQSQKEALLSLAKEGESPTHVAERVLGAVLLASPGREGDNPT